MNTYPNYSSSPFKPSGLADFVISNPASRAQLAGILSGKLPFPLFGKNCIILSGIYGTGKSTLALLLPQLLEQSGFLVGSQPDTPFVSSQYWHLTECAIGMNSATMLIDLNKRCKNRLNLSSSGWHYELLDEVDNLTTAAQASLKSTISFAVGTIFVLTTNHPSKLDRGLIDRSICIEMNMGQLPEYVPLGQRFFRQMGLAGDEVSASVFEQLADASKGSLREFGTAVATLGIQHGGSL